MSQRSRTQLQKLSTNITILPLTAVDQAFRNEVAANPDATTWLSKLNPETRPTYTLHLAHFLKCTGMPDPTALLDLKAQENIKKRYFPAEHLVETWQAHARKAGVKPVFEKKTIDALRSIFKHNRIPLSQITVSYRPKPKQGLPDNQLRKFRESMSQNDRILFDFLLSVPLRDGQFQTCPHCKTSFHPRWRHILTYPRIEYASPFAITPEKGHENSQYPEDLKQVCFLTETAAQGLQQLRDNVTKALGAPPEPDDPILTYRKSVRSGHKHISPLGQNAIQEIFLLAKQRTGINIYPHLLRSWVNTRLAACGIDKQLRDIYLGHTGVQNKEQGYIIQMIPRWQQAFKDAKALDSIDILRGVIGPEILGEKLQQIEKERRELAQLKREIQQNMLTKEELDNLRWLAAKTRQQAET